MQPMNVKQVSSTLGLPVVRGLCAYEVVALTVRKTRFERYLPTLSTLTARYRWQWRDPRFWISAGLFGWLAAHLWVEK